MSLPNPPASFFGLVALLILPFYLLGALGPDLTRLLPIQLPVSALMFVVPAAAALWLVHRTAGKTGVQKLWERVLDWRRIPSPLWLLPTLLLMPALMWLSYLVQRALGQHIPAEPLPWLALGVMFVAFFVGAVGGRTRMDGLRD